MSDAENHRKQEQGGELKFYLHFNKRWSILWKQLPADQTATSGLKTKRLA